MFQEHFGGQQFDPFGRRGLGAMFGRSPMPGGNFPAMQAPAFRTGGPGQVQQMPQFGGQLPARQFQPMTGGGYDSSGINPGGMYGGPQFQQAQFPRNPGGFMPMGGLAGLFRGY